MEQPQVGPKGKGVASCSESHTALRGSTESNYPDEHGYEEMGTGAFAARMGQGKNSASRLARFLLFSANPSLMGSSVPMP